MNTPYTPPQYGLPAFNCVYCHAYSHQIYYACLSQQENSGNQLGMANFSYSKCSNCNKFTLWYSDTISSFSKSAVIIFPSSFSSTPLAHSDLPENCKNVYQEAALVFRYSPKSSAALLRLCIQLLMPHLGEKGKDINTDIKNLVSKGLPIEIQKALDVCRVVGNNGVHPGEIKVDENPEIVYSMFGLINFIVENRISQPKKLEELYNSLPKNTLEAIEKRDSTKEGS